MSVYGVLDYQVMRSAALQGPHYRYSLHRDWTTPLDPGYADEDDDDREWSPRVCTFIMLNPSTADDMADDPTIRRCVGFARALGCTALRVVNLYAYRATSPADLWKAADPVGGYQADSNIAQALAFGARDDSPVIAGWGVHARPDRVERVLAMPGADRLLCLGVTKSGAPRHPLYVSATTSPVSWP